MCIRDRFEALHTAGGVLMYGIPEFRLPKAIVQKEIDTLKDLGVEFVLNFVVGRSETIDELFADGYEAVSYTHLVRELLHDLEHLADHLRVERLSLIHI